MVKVTQTNPQAKLGMEVFLSDTKKEEGEKMKVKAQPPNTNPQPSEGEKAQTNLAALSQPKETKSTGKQNLTSFEEKVRELEKILKNVRELEFSKFNQLAYEKKLKFKLLVVTSKIYLKVTDGNREAIIALSVPRWGGSGLRYLIASCSTQYCQAIQKQTNKGTIITYAPLGVNTNDEEEPDDIFD